MSSRQSWWWARTGTLPTAMTTTITQYDYHHHSYLLGLSQHHLVHYHHYPDQNWQIY